MSLADPELLLKNKHSLLPYPSVRRQRKGSDGGFQLFLGGGWVAAAAGDRSDLNVELFWLVVVKVRVAGVKVVVLQLRTA